MGMLAIDFAGSERLGVRVDPSTGVIARVEPGMLAETFSRATVCGVRASMPLRFALGSNASSWNQASVYFGMQGSRQRGKASAWDGESLRLKGRWFARSWSQTVSSQLPIEDVRFKWSLASQPTIWRTRVGPNPWNSCVACACADGGAVGNTCR